MHLEKQADLFRAEILIDQREKLPFDFLGVKADKDEGGGVLRINHRKTHLKTGDYSLAGHEMKGICVERKSKEDLLQHALPARGSVRPRTRPDAGVRPFVRRGGSGTRGVAHRSSFH